MKNKIKLYGNICKNINCGLNNDTEYCARKNKKSNKSSKCLCNIESSRCVMKKKNKDFLKNIEIREKKIITGLSFSKTQLKKCFIIDTDNSKYWFYLKQIKKCFPLPNDTNLKYGILKYNRELIVYNDNNRYYHLRLVGSNLSILIDNYEILVVSLNDCNLISK